jgi:putative methyltransferase
MISQLRVLISEPQKTTAAPYAGGAEPDRDETRPFLPYVWAVLKSHWERADQGRDYRCEWLDPIWRSARVSELLDREDILGIDVLGLSCYTWNWALQCAIATAVKEHNPDCVVVAGGPEPDYNDPDFFLKYPFIDAVVVKDGEIAFSSMLDSIACGVRDYSDIAGLVLPGGADRLPRVTGAPVVPTVFDYSPYIAQSEFYSRFAETHPPSAFDAIMETSRGCPYGCSFCDWGSSTMSKVRRFSPERVAAEADWFGRMRVGRIMLADANFGLLPRDVDLAEVIVAMRAENEGYPRHVYWSAAKNHPERVVAIAKTFAREGMCPSHSLSIQHTSEIVLAATARSNIAVAKQIAVVSELLANGVPIEVQLILGIPGDTYEQWKACFADLMSWGVHEDYLIQTYRLLPNAPAAEKGFREKWAIETIARAPHNYETRDLRAAESAVETKHEQILVSSASFTRRDWVRMSTYAAWIKALHSSPLMQPIARYLHHSHGASYLEIYEPLIEEKLAGTAPTANWNDAVRDHYEWYLGFDGASDHIAMPELPDFEFALHPAKWLYVKICRDLDRFFAVVDDDLTARFPAAQALSDLIAFQRQVVILPTFDRETPPTISAHHDWPAYFAELDANAADLSQTHQPPALLMRKWRGLDRTTSEGSSSAFGTALEWGDAIGDKRWEQWIRGVVLGRESVALRSLQELRPLPVGS